MNYELLFKFRKDIIASTRGRPIQLNFADETISAEAIILKLTKLEKELPLYSQTSGFRNLPSYYYDSTDQLKRNKIFNRSAFIWADPSEEINKKISEVENRGGVIFDIRKEKDFKTLAPFFIEEYNSLKEILINITGTEEAFPVKPPFMKCPCFHCMVIGKPMVDLFFTTDLLGRYKNIEIQHEIRIGLPERELLENEVIANKNVSWSDHGTIIEKKVKPKPYGYYEKENHTLFIMGYIHFYLLFETYQDDEKKLRQRLKRCNYCNDFYIKDRIQDSDFTCGRAKCETNKSNSNSKKNSAQNRYK
jgi:hypothetical protein